MDEKFMKRAIELAKKGEGRVSPNPLVGGVVVKGGRIIGEGYHGEFGGDHGEIVALDSCRESSKGADLYVNLEPCSHIGKTPPCVDRIIREGISRVFIGVVDPNPKVAGRGVKKLRENGIQVEIGLMEDESRILNEVFIKYIREKTPYVVLKSGMSIDGKIATRTGQSKWITGEESRRNSHGLRNKYSGILVGIGTVLQDDPSLTCRLSGGVNPMRIIVDDNLKIPLTSRVLKDQDQAKTIIGTIKDINPSKKTALEDMGIAILEVGRAVGGLDLRDLFIGLGNMGIDSILVEGGGSLNYSLVQENLVDKLSLYMAPRIIGGRVAKTFMEGEGIGDLADSFNFKIQNIQILGEDLLIEAYRRG